jgi:DNA-directed RNA polymerase beta' subunit
MFLNNTHNIETNVTKQIQFGVYSEQDILKSSVCEINSLLIYDKTTGLPFRGGLNDPRMGVTMRNI